MGGKKKWHEGFCSCLQHLPAQKSSMYYQSRQGYGRQLLEALSAAHLLHNFLKTYSSTVQSSTCLQLCQQPFCCRICVIQQYSSTVHVCSFVSSPSVAQSVSDTQQCSAVQYSTVQYSTCLQLCQQPFCCTICIQQYRTAHAGMYAGRTAVSLCFVKLQSAKRIICMNEKL